MEISWKMTNPEQDGETMRLRSITIELDRDDDPDGHLVGLCVRGRLEAFLQTYPRPGDLGWGSGITVGTARSLLGGLSFVTGMCDGRLEAMMVAARDWMGMTWGEIASATDQDRSTVRRHIIRERDLMAGSGAWYDLAGLHTGDKEKALEHARAARETDGKNWDS
jgi:hypothetical protein